MSEHIGTPAGGGITRRRFIGGVAGTAGLLLTGCGGGSKPAAVHKTFATEAEKWKQYSGKKLRFITENTPPSTGIRKLVERGDFKALTGIDATVEQFALPVMLQTAEISLRAGGTTYDLVYAQDKPVTSVLADYFEDLAPYTTDQSLPQAKEGYGNASWLPNYANVADYAYTNRLIAIPYDSADSIFAYRRDLFEKYTDKFHSEYGYPLAYGPDTTWKQVLDFATFFNKMHQVDSSVPYGIGLHLGNFAWTTQLDIQRILFSHGRWRDFNIDDIKGSKHPGKTNWGDEQSIKGLELYKKLFDQSTPDALALGTVEVADAFAAGKVAMETQYHEDAATFESGSASGGGRTAYDVCPKGDKEYLVGDGPLVNGTNCGIAGISMNRQISEEQKRAAWLFIVWSTLPETQLESMKIAGGTPTRTATLEIPEVAQAQGKPYGLGKTGRVGPSPLPNALTFPAIQVGMSDPNVILGPKIPTDNEYNTIVANEIQKMCAGKQSPAATARSIQHQTDAVNGV